MILLCDIISSKRLTGVAIQELWVKIPSGRVRIKTLGCHCRIKHLSNENYSFD